MPKRPTPGSSKVSPTKEEQKALIGSESASPSRYDAAKQNAQGRVDDAMADERIQETAEKVGKFSEQTAEYTAKASGAETALSQKTAELVHADEVHEWVEGLEPPKCCTKCCGDPKGLLYGFLPITVEDRLPEGFAQERWDAIGDCSCCEYKNRDVACGSNACYCLCKSCPVYCQECTWCMDLCSAHSGYCIMFGQITTELIHEPYLKRTVCNREVSCCFGQKGLQVCLVLCPTTFLSCYWWYPVGACGAAMQRARIIKSYQLEDNQLYCKACCCYPCALWKHLVFVSEMKRKLVELGHASDDILKHPLGPGFKQSITECELEGDSTHSEGENEHPEAPSMYQEAPGKTD